MMIEVVAVATPRGLLRSIRAPFACNPRDAIENLVKAIGTINLQDTQWTGMYYYTPPYLRYERPEVGIWLWPWVTSGSKNLMTPYSEPRERFGDFASVWNDPRRRYTISTHKELLWKPLGW